jgi:hypothetical protein
MFGRLTHCTDDQLLDYVMLILASPEREISQFHMGELEEIEAEFMRRGTLCGEVYDVIS